MMWRKVTSGPQLSRVQGQLTFPTMGRQATRWPAALSPGLSAALAACLSAAALLEPRSSSAWGLASGPSSCCVSQSPSLLCLCSRARRPEWGPGVPVATQKTLVPLRCLTCCGVNYLIIVDLCPQARRLWRLGLHLSLLCSQRPRGRRTLGTHCCVFSKGWLGVGVGVEDGWMEDGGWLDGAV